MILNSRYLSSRTQKSSTYNNSYKDIRIWQMKLIYKTQHPLSDL